MTFKDFKSYMEDVCASAEIKESSVGIIVFTSGKATHISKMVLDLELSEFLELMEQIGI